MANTTWKAIVGYEGVYEISDIGRVRSLDRISAAGKRLKGRLITTCYRDGYAYVNLHDDVRYPGRQRAVSIHRLVLDAFTGPCPDGMEACHNNGEPADNRLSNLRWDTHENNIRDKVAHGSAAPDLGTVPSHKIERARELFSLGVSVKTIFASENWPSPSTLRRALEGVDVNRPNADTQKMLKLFDDDVAEGRWRGLIDFTMRHDLEKSLVFRRLKRWRGKEYDSFRKRSTCGGNAVFPWARRAKKMCSLNIQLTVDEMALLEPFAAEHHSGKRSTAARHILVKYLKGYHAKTKKMAEPSDVVVRHEQPSGALRGSPEGVQGT